MAIAGGGFRLLPQSDDAAPLDDQTFDRVVITPSPDAPTSSDLHDGTHQISSTESSES
jgi:hypothetical protein